MKFKYRLILRGDNRYAFECKPKGFFGSLYKWRGSYSSYDTQEKAIDAMEYQIKSDNESHMMKYKKVIKVIEND